MIRFFDFASGAAKGAPPAGQGSPIFTQSLSSADALGRQLIVRRHLQVFIVVRHRENQLGRFGLSGHEHRAVLATLHDRGERVEPQAPLLFLFGVAGKAVFDQQRADFGLEEAKLLGRRLGGLSCGSGQA